MLRRDCCTATPHESFITDPFISVFTLSNESPLSYHHPECKKRNTTQPEMAKLILLSVSASPSLLGREPLLLFSISQGSWRGKVRDISVNGGLVQCFQNRNRTTLKIADARDASRCVEGREPGITRPDSIEVRENELKSWFVLLSKVQYRRMMLVKEGAIELMIKFCQCKTTT